MLFVFLLVSWSSCFYGDQCKHVSRSDVDILEWIQHELVVNDLYPPIDSMQKLSLDFRLDARCVDCRLHRSDNTDHIAGWPCRCQPYIVWITVATRWFPEVRHIALENLDFCRDRRCLLTQKGYLSSNRQAWYTIVHYCIFKFIPYYA